MRWGLVLVGALSLHAGAQEAEIDPKIDPKIALHRNLTQARALRNGTGVAPDKPRAARLFEQAALQGDADAAFTLANMLRDGDGVPQDAPAARRWLQRAADGESPEALQQLAMEEADPARAAQLFREAAHALTHRAR